MTKFRSQMDRKKMTEFWKKKKKKKNFNLIKLLILMKHPLKHKNTKRYYKQKVPVYLNDSACDETNKKFNNTKLKMDMLVTHFLKKIQWIPVPFG